VRVKSQASEAFPNKAAVEANPNLASPVVVRAAIGDCSKAEFTNEIPGKRIGMHADLGYDPKNGGYSANIGHMLAPNGSGVQIARQADVHVPGIKSDGSPND
jgi:hypothetical protein